jgi:hypothetical protein
MKTRIALFIAALFCTQLAVAQWSTYGSTRVYTYDRVGIGTTLPTADLQINNGYVRITPDPEDDYGLIFTPTSTSNVNFDPFISNNGHLLFDINLETPDSQSDAIIRFFRKTNTTGSRRVDFLRGTSTTNVAARISVDGGNSYFNRYDGNVGIGIASPKAKLDVKGDFRLQSSNNHSFGMEVGTGGNLKFVGDGGETVLDIDDNSGDVTVSKGNFHLEDGNIGIGISNPLSRLHIDGTLRLQSPNNNSFRIRVEDDGDLHFVRDGDNTAMIINDYNGAVGIGSNMTSIPSGYQLAVNGNVRCREVRVTNQGWADFVFADNYQLKSLTEVEQFIKENNHLPDVPSEAEVLENGTDLGKIDAILLQKIEELTLYMIELKKENDELREEIEALK